jgi:hypothetical protein
MKPTTMKRQSMKRKTMKKQSMKKRKTMKRQNKMGGAAMSAAPKKKSQTKVTSTVERVDRREYIKSLIQNPDLGEYSEKIMNSLTSMLSPHEKERVMQDWLSKKNDVGKEFKLDNMAKEVDTIVGEHHKFNNNMSKLFTKL